MGWFARLLRWLLGGGDRGAGASPVAEADPYFAGSCAPVIQKSKNFGLDAGAFLPIAREEIIGSARRRKLFANPWFGRRDQIPPASDERTVLIDRAMVTQGLITPEELAEIHGVGEEMERVRPSIAGTEHQAALAGTAAVEAENEARLRLKALKKEEAARRREERNAAIAYRRGTDIIFLGAGFRRKCTIGKAISIAWPRRGCPHSARQGSWRRCSGSRFRICAGWLFTARRRRFHTTFGSRYRSAAAARARWRLRTGRARECSASS